MKWLGGALGAALMLLLVLPLVALVCSSSPAELVGGLRHPLFLPALGLSLRTSALSLALVVLGGTPLALWLVPRRRLQALVELPVVVPPAVLGVGLLMAFGRQGVLPAGLPFSTAAVVVAQVVVSAPFYVSAAVSAFRRVDPELVLVARTLGATPFKAWWRVALPLAAPGLLAGAALSWARSLGEFGATLLFAGNMTGVTQTMPLAIFSALEQDIDAAVSLSLVLLAVAVVALAGMRR
jgi:molybdate transport system permease protein